IWLANAFDITALTVIPNDTELGLHDAPSTHAGVNQFTQRVNIIRVDASLEFGHRGGGLLFWQPHNTFIFVRDVLDIRLDMPVPGARIADFFSQNKRSLAGTKLLFNFSSLVVFIYQFSIQAGSFE